MTATEDLVASQLMCLQHELVKGQVYGYRRKVEEHPTIVIIRDKMAHSYSESDPSCIWRDDDHRLSVCSREEYRAYCELYKQTILGVEDNDALPSQPPIYFRTGWFPESLVATPLHILKPSEVKGGNVVIYDVCESQGHGKTHRVNPIGRTIRLNVDTGKLEGASLYYKDTQRHVEKTEGCQKHPLYPLILHILGEYTLDVPLRIALWRYANTANLWSQLYESIPSDEALSRLESYFAKLDKNHFLGCQQAVQALKAHASRNVPIPIGQIQDVAGIVAKHFILFMVILFGGTLLRPDTDDCMDVWHWHEQASFVDRRKFIHKLEQVLRERLWKVHGILPTPKITQHKFQDGNIQLGLEELKGIYKLWPNQLRTIQFILEKERTMVNGHKGGIVADDPGSGKTTSALVAALCYPKEFRSITLVVAPDGVVELTWERELNNESLWGQGRRPLTYHVIKRPPSHLDELYDVDFVLISYTTLMECFRNGKKGGSGLFAFPFARIYFDESSHFRGSKTLRAAAVSAIRSNASSCWGLTGTPIENSFSDLLNQVSLLGIPPYCEDDWLSTSQKHQRFAMLGAVMTRTVAGNIVSVDRTYHTELLTLNDAEREEYDRKSGHLNTADRSGVEYHYSRLLALGLCQSKLRYLKHLITSKHKDEGIVVYAQTPAQITAIYADILSYLDEEEVIKADIDPVPAVQDFIQNPRRRVIVLVLHTVCYGLNLQKASLTVVMTWGYNHAHLEQGEYRVMRPGQKRNVHHYRLVLQDTIEERVLRVITDKLHLLNQTVEAVKRKVNVDDNVLDILIDLYHNPVL